MGVSKFLSTDPEGEGFLLMSETASKMMTCARCGIAMNHHCDKLVYASDSQATLQVDFALLGGLIDEFHSCPQCGNTASRHASAAIF
jgi:ribosomal protein S27AE